jgi:hypothetical protein
MRVLGIKVWPEPLSDDEYVDRIRKAQNRPCILRYGTLVGGVCLLVAISVGVPALFKAITPPEPSDQNKSLPHLLIVVALGVGYFFGFSLHPFISLAMGTFGARTFRLLLECWEALHLEEDQEESSSAKTWGVQPLPMFSSEHGLIQEKLPLRIFGMRVRPEQPSDEQFVGKLRKSLPRLRLVCRLLNIVGGLLSTALVIFAFWFARFLGGFSISQGSRLIIYALFTAGMIFGFALHFAVNSIGLRFAGMYESRSNTLLVKYWDALHPREQATNR